MRYPASEKLEIIRLVEQSHLGQVMQGIQRPGPGVEPEVAGLVRTSMAGNLLAIGDNHHLVDGGLHHRILRSQLITMKGALATILGGSIGGITGLVMIATFDIKMVALYVVGIAGALVITERLSKYRALEAPDVGAPQLRIGG